ncbi:MAG: TolC family protein [Flavipsychrobacter sp.]
MRQLSRVVSLFLFLCLAWNTQAQSADVWTLQRCVKYAIDHNISIQQDVLNARLAKYTLLQSQLAQLPNANLSASYGRSYGRSIDPTSNQFIDANYDFVSVGGTSNVLLFGWFQQRNLISKNKYSLLASKSDLDQLKDDVSLNVATGYLRAILAKEQIGVSKKQVELSMAQLDQTRKFYNAGRVPELNVAQLESQVATDSSNLISSIANYTSTIIDLKTLLNIDFSEPFEIIAPDVKVADQVTIANLTPDDVYQEAHKHFGAIKAADYRVTSAQKGVNAARGALLPQLSFGVQIGTNWASTYKQVSRYDTAFVPIGYVNNATNDLVYSPQFVPVLANTPFGTQLNNNFRQTYALSLTMPLFNGWQSQYAVKQAKYNMNTQELNKYQAELNLKQSVYKAYSDATNSIQKYYAAVHAAESAERAQDFAKKRYDLGLTSTIDYLTTQNTQYAAESNMLSAKYDLIFKLKVIDYYLGKELKL